MTGEVRVVFTTGSNKSGAGSIDSNFEGKPRANLQTIQDVANTQYLTDLEQQYSGALRVAVLGTSKVLIDNAFYELGKQFDFNDDVKGKRQLQIARQMTTKAMGVVGAMVGGYKVGGLFGMMAGAVGGVAGISLDMYKANDQQNIEISREQNQLSFVRLRSGSSLVVGSKGENR